MKHRPAAAAAPCQTNAILLHPPGIALFPRVLRLADHYGFGITPQEEDFLRGHFAEDALFYRQIKPGIVGIGNQ
ncbi:hypothetical protein D3C81_1941420 [compost metagenome]